MVALALLGAAAFGGFTLHEVAEGRRSAPALVVVTPGFELSAYAALVDELSARGHPVHLLAFDCGQQDLGALVESTVQAAATLPDDKVVVAHGVGASLALLAAPEVQASRYVLLAPVLAVRPGAALSWLAERELPPRVDLSGRLEWAGQDLAPLLLGAEAPLTCLPGPFARDLAVWVRGGQVPIPWEAVTAPVWIGLGLTDEIATVEAVVPASRNLARREVIRLGTNRLDPVDFGHLDMLSHRIPARVAARAAGK